MNRISIFICLLLTVSLSFCKDKNKKKKVDTESASGLKINKIAELPSILRESSGLCYTDGNLWSFEDSGNPAAIYKIDTTTGAILQTVNVTNFPNVDWEDITADNDFIYIGDFGNNNGNRTDQKILRIKKSDLKNNAAVLNVTADAISFSYADQLKFKKDKRSNYDCEAMISIDNNLYIFTKNTGDFKTRVYQLPKVPGNYPVSPITGFDTKGRITGASYNAATKEIALTGYLEKHKGPFMYFLNGYSGNQFFNGKAKRIDIAEPDTDWQVEGVDYISATHLFISCETSDGGNAALYSVMRNPGK